MRLRKDASGVSISGKMKMLRPLVIHPVPRHAIGYPICRNGASPCTSIGSPAC